MIVGLRHRTWAPGFLLCVAACTQPGSQQSSASQAPNGVGDYVVPNLCDLARGATLLVEAQASVAAQAMGAAQAGFPPIQSRTLYFGTDSSAVPLTLSITGTVFGTAPTTSLPVWTYGTMFQPPGGTTTGYYFLTQYAGKWVLLWTGFFWKDSAGLLENGGYYDSPAIALTEADFSSGITAARTSTAPCWPSTCVVNGGIETDAGGCAYPDSGRTYGSDGG